MAELVPLPPPKDADADAAVVPVADAAAPEPEIRRRWRVSQGIRNWVLHKRIDAKVLDYYGLLEVMVGQGPVYAGIVIPTITRLEEYAIIRIENLTRYPLHTQIDFKNPLLEVSPITLYKETILQYFEGLANAFGKRERRVHPVFMNIKITMTKEGCLHIQANPFRPTPVRPGSQATPTRSLQ